jgi:hypothetical protein
MIINILYQIKIDENLWFGEDENAKRIFFDVVLREGIVLHSNEIGEEISDNVKFLSAQIVEDV